MSWIQMLAATFTIVRWKQKCCLHHVHCASDSHIRSFLTTWRREVTVIHGFQKEIKTPVRPDSYWKSDLNLLLQTEGEVNGTLWTPSFIDSPTLFAFGEAGDAFKTYFSSHCKGSCICLTDCTGLMAASPPHVAKQAPSPSSTENAPFHSHSTSSLLTTAIKISPGNPMFLLVQEQNVVH